MIADPEPPVQDFRIDTGTSGPFVSVRVTHLPTGVSELAHGKGALIARKLAMAAVLDQLWIDPDGEWHKRKWIPGDQT